MNPKETPRVVEEQDSVEAAWRSIFTRYGVDEKRADLFTKLSFATPELTLGYQTNPEMEILEIVSESLDNIDYEEHLEPKSDPDAVRDELMQALTAGLDGRIRGPAMAPPAVARSSGVKPGPDTDTDKPPQPQHGAPAAQRPQPQHGAPAQATGFHQDIADILEDLIKDRDITRDDLRTAIDIMDERQANDGEERTDLGSENTQ